MYKLFFFPGICSRLDLAIPESGTVIAEFSDNTMELDFFCRLRNNDSQIVSNWFILSASRREQGLGPNSILLDNQQYTQSGDDIVTESLAIPSNTNLTVNGITTDLHNSTLSCGSDMDLFIAVFTIFVYGKLHFLSSTPCLKL